jgi:hypothetical protein
VIYDQRNDVYVQLYSRAERTISSSWKTGIGITVDDLLDQKTPCNGLLKNFACTRDFRKMFVLSLFAPGTTGILFHTSGDV